MLHRRGRVEAVRIGGQVAKDCLTFTLASGCDVMPEWRGVTNALSSMSIRCLLLHCDVKGDLVVHAEVLVLLASHP